MGISETMPAAGDTVLKRRLVELQAAIRAASPWTGGALCWCRSDDAPDCDTPACVELRMQLAEQG